MPYPLLLLDIISHRVAAKMPNDRSCTETDRIAFVLQSPTEIHIISGGAEHGIKPIDGLQRFPPKSHVAARYVLSDFIVQQHVSRRARRDRHAVGNQGTVGRREIRASHRAKVR